MSINFDIIRPLFGGKMTQAQVDGINSLQAIFSDPTNGFTDKRFQAYGYATPFLETGATMQPIEEWGKGVGKAYGTTYYGRGYVQLTWLYNYTRFGPLLKGKPNLVKTPSLALVPANAAQILVIGMTQGTFTGKKLSDYFNTKVTDPLNARRIINGTNRAQDVADYYETFLRALN